MIGPILSGLDTWISAVTKLEQAINNHTDEINKLTQEVIKLNERIEDASPRGGQSNKQDVVNRGGSR